MGLWETLNDKRESGESTGADNREKVEQIRTRIQEADAVLIGAGAGLSTAAGLTYAGERFERHFADFIARYGMTDMYWAGFYPFETQEEKWAYWSRHIYYNRYDLPALAAYVRLKELVREKDYFVLTTNVDHQFWLAGFADERIFATQGDYGYFQCASGCHKKLYDNEALVREMVRRQRDLRIPSELVCKCPVCGGNMEVNLRCDEHFVEDDAWNEAAVRYERFLQDHKDKKMVLLELGVGMNTPGIIKYPFWRMTREWQQSGYICINAGQAWAPPEIEERALCVDADIAGVLENISPW